MSNYDYSGYYDGYPIPQQPQPQVPSVDSSTLVTKLLQNGLAASVEELVRKQLEQMGAAAPPVPVSTSRAVAGIDQLEPYDPDAPVTNIERWILRFEELGERYGWSDLEKMYLLKTKLVGRARDWYTRRDLACPHYQWENWKKELWDAFMIQIDFGADLEELVRRRKRQTETFRQYYEEKVALCERCGIGGEKAVSVIIRGLPDVFRAQAKALGCCAPEAFRAQFVEVADRGPREPEPVVIIPSRGHFSPPREHERGHEQSWKRGEEKVPRQDRTARGKCFKCGQMGHHKGECKERKRPRIEKRSPM